MKEKLIDRFDKHGNQLYEGDIIRQCDVGDIIWDGDGVIVDCPLGVVVTYPIDVNAVYDDPEVTDRYNVIRFKTGMVKLKDDLERTFLRYYEKDGVWYCPLYLSTYDGKFYGWDKIEKIGSIYDLERAFNTLYGSDNAITSNSNE